MDHKTLEQPSAVVPETGETVTQSPVPPENDIKKPQKKIKFTWTIGIVLLVIIFLGGLLWTGWYLHTQMQKTTSVKSTEQPQTVQIKKLIIGTDLTDPPMEYIDKGKYVGYDIDLSNALAKELNTSYEIKNITFDDLFTALEQKKIDMIISAVTITDERKMKYDFSEQYLNAGQVILTRKDETSIKTTADLKGKKIGVQQGTTNETEALLYTSPKLVIRFADFGQATKALVEGKVDAEFNDLPGAKGVINQNPTLKIASDPITNEYYGIVFRKGDLSVKQVNQALDSLSVKGILADLKQKWLN